MALLDEIKKVSFTPIKFEQVTEPTSFHKPRVFVDLADIEKILGEMKCEKCIHNDQDSACTFCQHLGIFFSDNPELKFCSQFEVKE